MDPQNKMNGVQAIIKRFLAKMAKLDAKKNKVIGAKQQTDDARALAQAQDKIKNL